MNWYVIYTKSRCEKKVNENLLKKGIESYCPTQIILKEWSDRKQKIHTPLFTSYVFVKINEADFNVIRSQQHVVNFIYWLGKPAIVREEEINILKFFLSKKTNLEVESSNLKIGDKIKIALKNIPKTEAIILKIENNKVVLHLTQLGIQVKTILSNEDIAQLKSNSK